jgi:OHCU decarboxylase
VQPCSLSQLNSLARDEFTSIIGPVFECSPWIAEATWASRPFLSLDQLHGALCAIVQESGEEKQLALIAAHPDLVGRAALEGTLTPASTSEQAAAGLNRLAPEEIAAFQRFNRAYRDKFGFPFVICARLNRKEAILSAFPARLAHGRVEEIKAALEEIYKIAYFRLQDIVGP